MVVMTALDDGAYQTGSNTYSVYGRISTAVDTGGGSRTIANIAMTAQVRRK